MRPAGLRSFIGSPPGRSAGWVPFAVWLLVASLPLAGEAVAQGTWAEPAWPFRRAVDVEWDAKKMAGDETAQVDFWTAGQHASSGESVRVATEDGKVVPAKVIMTGPGDRMRVLFAPARGVKRHYVYWGHPSPPRTPPAIADVPQRAGVLMEMRKTQPPLSGSAQQMAATWEKSRPMVGRMLVDRLYGGINPFSEDVGVIVRYSASLIVPEDGDYTFAGAASDRGCLWIANQPVLWIPASTGDTRFNASIKLKKGRHDLVCYIENAAGEQRLSVVWKRPGRDQYELIPPEAFGVSPKTTVGAMEHKTLAVIADMKIDYGGEAFFLDHFSHRYRFTAQGGRGTSKAPAKIEWDFGDGQTATGPAAEHVYLKDGIYPVTLTVTVGPQKDVRTNRISVSRLYERIDAPPGDLPQAHARLVSGYELAKLPVEWLPVVCRLFEKAGDAASLEKAAVRLAGVRAGIDANTAVLALMGAADELARQGSFDAAARVWEAVPAGSPHEAAAARHYAELLVWRIGDFAKAVKVIEPQAKQHAANAVIQRQYAHALILAQRIAEGRKVLEKLPVGGPADRQGALAGALARTIEYYIKEGDWDAGEQQWEKWQAQYPADFMEGYSVLLRTELMETAKAPAGAAKVAEAFALAVPKSSYAPRLLDRASKLLARTDPAKSKALRDLLKQKYPEDPLSQDNKVAP